jgi:uncharacterized membrane protein
MTGNNTSARQSYVFVLFFLGFLMLIIGIAILLLAVVLSGNSVNFGGVIVIGPLPIVVGAGPEATLMAILAIILTILSILMFLMVGRRK